MLVQFDVTLSQVGWFDTATRIQGWFDEDFLADPITGTITLVQAPTDSTFWFDVSEELKFWFDTDPPAALLGASHTSAATVLEKFTGTAAGTQTAHTMAATGKEIFKGAIASPDRAFSTALLVVKNALLQI